MHLAKFLRSLQKLADEVISFLLWSLMSITNYKCLVLFNFIQFGLANLLQLKFYGKFLPQN
jgi:hypothetical protein